MTDTRLSYRIPEFTDKGTFTGFQYIEVGDFIETTLCGSEGTPEQCTGVKDIEGKYIYENDVVKLPKGDIIWVVKFYKHFLGFVLEEYSETPSIRTITGDGDNSSSLNKYKIIGNLHEGYEDDKE